MKEPPLENKVCLVVLGCPKNIVEVESMAGFLKNNGWALTTDLNNSNAAIIHTCSFIKDARDESVRVIKNLSRLRKKGKIEKLIVSGCLVQGEGRRLSSEFPDVDGFIGTGNLKKVLELLSGEKSFILGSPGGLLDTSFPRLLSSTLPSAYLRIAEGCSHKCSFCSIPVLRGKYKSRNISSIYREAKDLSLNGIRELILIAQDTTSYGKDNGKNIDFPKLLEKLAGIDDLEWIRIMYTYPNGVTDGLLNAIKANEKICRYIDLPLQHISNDVLKNMARPQNAVELVKSIKAKIPELALRTSFIVGFPGETEKDFKKLYDFVSEGWFDQLGVFEYSDNKDTASHYLKGQVPEVIKKERRKRLMLKQLDVVLKKNESLKGRIFKTLVESKDKKNTYSGRAYFQAPEIDSKIYFKGRVKNASFVNVKITGYKGYDLTGVEV